jgi:hypothetical protein
VLTGSTNDISPLLAFQWYEPVYYKIDDSDFPSDSCEGCGCFVGILEHVGHHMTFKILMDDTNKIIHHSNVCSALSKEDRNLKVDLLNDDSFVANPILKSCHDSPDHPDHGEGSDMPVIDPEDLVGHTFLMDKQEDGTQFHAHIVHAIEDHECDLKNHPDHIYFLCSVNDDELEEIVSYNELVSKLALLMMMMVARSGSFIVSLLTKEH